MTAVTSPILAEHADAIRSLGKQTVENIIEIGRRLTEAKKIAGHGGWLWLEREFEWKESTALRFMRVHELTGKSAKLTDLEFPVSSLYLLAAPSTPEAAKQKVVERAEAGEKLTVAGVKRVIEDTKGRKQPTKRPTKEVKAKAKTPKHDSRIIAPKLADRVGRFAHDLILSERLLARELADIIMLPGVRERLSADLTNGLALLGNDADPETSADRSERTL